MDRTLVNNSLRFVLLWAAQVFLFKQISLNWDGRNLLEVQIYPLFILLLPLRTPRSLMLGLAFALGLSIDIFYETLGFHAAAATFTAYLRNPVLRILTPRDGYNVNNSPTKDYLGGAWFFRYAAILVAAHLFWYFSVEAFTFAYILIILQKTIISWGASMLFILMFMYTLNPKV